MLHGTTFNMYSQCRCDFFKFDWFVPIYIASSCVTLPMLRSKLLRGVLMRRVYLFTELFTQIVIERHLYNFYFKFVTKLLFYINLTSRVICISTRLILSSVILTYRFENLSQELHAIHVIRNTRVPVQPSFPTESETAGWLINMQEYHNVYFVCLSNRNRISVN